MTGPVDVPYSGAWPMSGAWLCQHLWQRYLYNGDRDYLRSVYPYMKGAAEFFVDFMVTDPRNGHLVVCPSVSPENAPKRKPKANLYAGITMDNQLVADLFTNTAAMRASCPPCPPPRQPPRLRSAPTGSLPTRCSACAQGSSRCA